MTEQHRRYLQFCLAIRMLRKTHTLGIQPWYVGGTYYDTFPTKRDKQIVHASVKANWLNEEELVILKPLADKYTEDFIFTIFRGNQV